MKVARPVNVSRQLRKLRKSPTYCPPFVCESFMVSIVGGTGSSSGIGVALRQASIRIRVGQEVFLRVAEGNGPVNALYNALVLALTSQSKVLAAVKLENYQVRISGDSKGTDALVRVLIRWSDWQRQWYTEGISTDVVEASLSALLDSFRWWLHRDRGVSY